ncbi:MAG TPA: hypothetical protein PLH84_12485 [Candidatus Krumholzibacteria bacterium]|nr:hypothetical protein [Candidatus Krumholzibacteria bacterium]
MKHLLTTILLGALLTTAAAAAEAPREDVIWARVASGTLTLDGVLNEPEWSAAETKTLVYGTDSGKPGSGWKAEAGWPPSDPTTATFRFLAQGDQLWMAVQVQDASLGGSREFNRFDGLLMALKNHLPDAGSPAPPAEYLYSLWNPDTVDPQPTTQDMNFIGYWGNFPPEGAVRTPEQIAAWDAVTVFDGTVNDDADTDVGYTIEMRFDVGVMGYDLSKPAGEIVEWNVSVYDTDWFWPLNALQFSSGRVWWQGPWGNASIYNEVRVHVRSDVTTASGAVPDVGAEITVPYMATATVAVDGDLSEPVWSDPSVYTWDMRWGDDALRDTYEGVGPYRAGQYQPPVNGGQALVIDPADATLKMFVQGDMLYMGFDVRDQIVQYHPVFDRWDGFMVLINDYELRGNDQNLQGYRLSFQVGEDGEAVTQDYLSTLVAGGDAEVAMNLVGTTTVDTLGQQADEGYTAELAIDLTSLGYPMGLGDRVLFIGVNMLDGDSLIPTTDSYGTRTWWYREYEGSCCPVWAHMAEPAVAVGDPEDTAAVRSRVFPSERPTVTYFLPGQRDVSLRVFDLRGREVAARQLGVVASGEHTVHLFDGGVEQPAGMYLYRLDLRDPGTGALTNALTGRSILVK